MNNENFDSEKYPCPRPDQKRFKHFWDRFLPDVKDRENLKPSHLMQLQILCDMCVEYEEHYEILLLEGRTYISTGRNGTQIKPRPEVALMKSLVSEIKNYSKMLGLVLVKDTKFKEDEIKNDFE